MPALFPLPSPMALVFVMAHCVCVCVCVCVRVCMCMCFKMAATDSLRTQHCCECHLGAQKVKRYIVIDSTISLL